MTARERDDTAADVGGAPDHLGGTPGRAAGGPLAARKARPSLRRALAGWAISLALALLLAFGIRTFGFQAFSIPSTSMVPALNAPRARSSGWPVRSADTELPGPAEAGPGSA
jgi:hypothetical protein